MQDNLINSNIGSGKLIKINEKESEYGNTYSDVHFNLINTGNFYRSCINTNCRNFSNWIDLLQLGSILSYLHLIMKYGKIFINTDSFPVLVQSGIPGIQSFNTKKNERKNKKEIIFLKNYSKTITGMYFILIAFSKKLE